MESEKLLNSHICFKVPLTYSMKTVVFWIDWV